MVYGGGRMVYRTEQQLSTSCCLAPYKGIYGGSEEHNISSDLSCDDIPLMEDHVQGKDIRRHHCTFPLIMKTLVDNGQVNSEHSMWDLNLVSKKHETSAQM